MVKIFKISALCLLAGACGPAGGPTTSNLVSNAYSTVESESNLIDYILVDMTEDIASTISKFGDNLQNDGYFSNQNPPAQVRIGSGDVLAITIFESGSGGLFVPTGVTLSQGNFVSLPEQEVGSDGYIKVPYAGRIRAKGKTIGAIQQEIEDLLVNRAIEPQVVITVTDRPSGRVSVIGDVNTPGQFNLSTSGEKILDFLARAGGPRFQPFETFITIQRGGSSAEVRMSALLKDSSNNVYVHPGDTISVRRDQVRYSVIGATNRTGQFSLESANTSLLDAIAINGGLADSQADPKTIAVYREEKTSALRRIGADVPEHAGKTQPVIYRLNVKESSGFFVAKRFKIRQGDIIYVSNAPVIDFLKVVNAVSSSLNGVNTVRSIRNTVQDF